MTSFHLADRLQKHLIKEFGPTVTSEMIQTFSIFSLYEEVTQTSTVYVVSVQRYTGTPARLTQGLIPEISVLHGLMWLPAIMVN